MTCCSCSLVLLHLIHFNHFCTAASIHAILSFDCEQVKAPPWRNQRDIIALNEKCCEIWLMIVNSLLKMMVLKDRNAQNVTVQCVYEENVNKILHVDICMNLHINMGICVCVSRD